MPIDSAIYNLINLVLKVILITLIPGVPALLLTLYMYAYKNYKKWSDKTDIEKEKIILGHANKIVVQDEELTRQSEEILRLEKDIKVLSNRKKSLEDELGVSNVPEVENQEVDLDLSKMNIKQLKELAKERNLKMYSKKNKQQLLKMLKE